MIEPIVIVHGGAGDIPDSRVLPKILGVKLAASIGYKILKNGGSILDAVEAAVVSMESDGAFNAGYGSCLNLDAKVEMEASIQRGSDLRAGGVALINEFSHPISLARRVLEDTPHSLLGGEGARRFAIKQGFKIIDPQTLVTQSALDALNAFVRKGGADGGSEVGDRDTKDEGGVGTVGAVGIDSEGRIAVATSTGGRTGKYVGRIGDTPQIGSGTYADDYAGGVSTTGHGESILKVCLAHSIVKLIEDGYSAQDATEKALDSMTSRLDQTAGAITLSNKGDVGIYFTTERMAWSYVQGNQIHYGIDKNQHDQEGFNVNQLIL